MGTPDPYAEAWQHVADGILGAPGELSSDERRAIADGDGPAQHAVLLDKLRNRAYTIVDSDLEGLSDDAAMELILAAALGAADERRRAALEAIDG